MIKPIKILVILGALLVTGFILYLVWILLSDLNKEFIVSVVAATSGYVGFLYTAKKSKEKEIEARLFPQKADVYGDIFNLIKDVLINTKKSSLNKKQQEKFAGEIAKKMIDNKTNLLIWGSEKTIRRYLDIDNSAELANSDSYAYIDKWAELYFSMRKDLGHKDASLTPKELMSIYLDQDAKKEYLNSQ